MITDKDKLLALLRNRGAEGVHTAELRRMGVSGNPSQRRLDLLADGYEIASERESYRGADGKTRPGARFTLTASPDPALASAPSETATSAPDSLRGVSGAGERGAEQPSLFVPPERPSYMDVDAFEDAA